MKKKVLEVPSWAMAMVDNFRKLGNIPMNISDVEIFNVVEINDICILDSDDQVDILRSELGLD